MTEATPIEAAIKRLALALDALESAVERRPRVERHEDALAEQVHALGIDRSQLAAELDDATARARRLETYQPRSRPTARCRDRNRPLSHRRARDG